MKIHIKSKDILAFQILLTAFVAFSNFKLVLYIAQLICLVILFQKVVRNGYRVKCKEYFIFFGAFTIWSFLSVGWAAAPDYSLAACKSIIQAFLIGLIIMMTISTPERIDEMLRTFPFANIVMIICLVIDWIVPELIRRNLCSVFSGIILFIYKREEKKVFGADSTGFCNSTSNKVKNFFVFYAVLLNRSDILLCKKSRKN